MISPITMFCLLIVHFVADFLLQPEKIALNKSKSWSVLLLHCAIYAACFCLWGWWAVSVLFVSHFVIDAVTSRIYAYLWAQKRTRAFFVVIGIDQMLHLMFLVVAAPWVY